MKREGVLVIGSSNMDLVVTANRFPNPGETIFGKNFEMFPGGKGANQAVCCARLGCKTAFIGKMGNDEFKEKLSKILIEDNVDISGLFTDENEHTGTALITVDETGQNQIIVISGSNMKLTPQDIGNKSALFESVKVVLTQLEIPIETVIKTAELAKQSNSLFILNPAPALHLPDSILPMIDYLTPNENELEILSESKITDETSLLNAAKKLIDKGVKNVIVTLGAKGAMLLNMDGVKYFSGFRVKAIDTTAAGDVFNGALAANLSFENSINKAIEFANKAASISVTRSGAQSSIPYKHEIII